MYGSSALRSHGAETRLLLKVLGLRAMLEVPGTCEVVANQERLASLIFEIWVDTRPKTGRSGIRSTTSYCTSYNRPRIRQVYTYGSSAEQYF